MILAKTARAIAGPTAQELVCELEPLIRAAAEDRKREIVIRDSSLAEGF
jgi:hypothetical protein